MSCSFQEGERCKQVSWVLRGKGSSGSQEHGKAGGQQWINIHQHSVWKRALKTSDSGVQAASWDGTCRDLLKNPVAQQLSDDRKGHRVTVSCYPLCEPLLRLLTRYTLRDNSHGAADLSPSQTFAQTRLHVSHLVFWEEKVTEVKLGRHRNGARAGCSRIHHLPSGMASTTHGLCCPKNTELSIDSQREILGAHFRGLLCQFTQMTLCKTGATSTQKSSSRRKLERVCLCNICKSVILRASPQLVHFILNAEAVLRS